MNAMTRRLMILMIGLVISFGSMASDQNKGDANANSCKFGKELKEFKYKFMAQEMQLSADQQKQFFEVYSQMSNEMRKTHGAVGRLHKAVKNGKQLSDAEYTKLYEDVASEKIAEGQVEKKYDEKFRTFLSPQQICKMKMAEIKFRDRLMKMRQDKSKKSKK